MKAGALLGSEGGNGLSGPQTSPHTFSLPVPFPAPRIPSCPPLSLCSCSSLCLEFLPHLLPLSKPFPVLQGPAREPPPPGSLPDPPAPALSTLSRPWSLCRGSQIVSEISASSSLSTQMPGELAEHAEPPSLGPHGPVHYAGSGPTVSVGLGADLSPALWSPSARRGGGCCNSGSGR